VNCINALRPVRVKQRIWNEALTKVLGLPEGMQRDTPIPPGQPLMVFISGYSTPTFRNLPYMFKCPPIFWRYRGEDQRLPDLVALYGR
jgi:hypothetical protein